MKKRAPKVFSYMRQALVVRGRMSRAFANALGLGAIGIALSLWCFITYTRQVTEGFLPSPTDIVQGIPQLMTLQELPADIYISVWRIAQAMFYTIIVGVPLGVLLGSLPLADALLGKFVDGIKSVPPTAFISLMILWFGIEERGKVIFLFIGAIFYMTLMCKNAVQNVREEYVTVARDIGANNMQTITRVLLPGALPQIWDAIIVCNGLMWTYIVLAEWVNAPRGLGHLLDLGSRLHRSEFVYLGIILIACISTLTDWLLRAFRKRFIYW